MIKKRRIIDPPHEKKPSLRISSIVYGREKIGTRVVYLVDARGNGTEKKNAEAVILYRWRRRVFKGYSFSGSKLNPKIWRNLPTILPMNIHSWPGLSTEEIEELMNIKKEYIKENFIKIPSPNILNGLLKICGSTRLEKLVLRHNSPEREKNFGTPDLFLFATHTLTKSVSIGRFVEVKKPEEPLKQDQHEEISFLQSLDLHARVMRLIERN